MRNYYFMTKGIILLGIYVSLFVITVLEETNFVFAELRECDFDDGFLQGKTKDCRDPSFDRILRNDKNPPCTNDYKTLLVRCEGDDGVSVQFYCDKNTDCKWLPKYTSNKFCNFGSRNPTECKYYEHTKGFSNNPENVFPLCPPKGSELISRSFACSKDSGFPDYVKFYCNEDDTNCKWEKPSKRSCTFPSPEPRGPLYNSQGNNLNVACPAPGQPPATTQFAMGYGGKLGLYMCSLPLSGCLWKPVEPPINQTKLCNWKTRGCNLVGREKNAIKTTCSDREEKMNGVLCGSPKKPIDFVCSKANGCVWKPKKPEAKMCIWPGISCPPPGNVNQICPAKQDIQIWAKCDSNSNIIDTFTCSEENTLCEWKVKTKPPRKCDKVIASCTEIFTARITQSDCPQISPIHPTLQECNREGKLICLTCGNDCTWKLC